MYLKELSGEGPFRLCSSRRIRNLSRYFGTLTAPFTVRVKDKRKAEMLEKTVYPMPDLKFSLKGLFMWEKLCQRRLSMNLHCAHICGADLGTSAPRVLSGVKPQSMPGAGLNCLQPQSDVPGRNHYSSLWTVRCLLVLLCRNKNNFNSEFCNKVAVVHTGALMQSLWA